MVEDLVKFMVERWYLPEAQVRAFLQESLPKGDFEMENLREVVASLLQDAILESE